MEKIQRQILNLVTAKFPQVYLVGGTAISLLYHHRVSEDLDFFSQSYTSKLHREIVEFIGSKTGYSYRLIEEEKRKRYLPMAVYEFDIDNDRALKVDFVQDAVDLFEPVTKEGLASIDDLYYRKILTLIGWKENESSIGKALAGGRQKTKDLFDVYYLSSNVTALSKWFPRYFDRLAYERLVAWHLSMPKQKTVFELMDLSPGCDAKAILKHLDEEVIYRLNKRFLEL